MTTYYYTPPSDLEVPPYGAQDENKQAAKLMRYYSPRPACVATFLMSDGTVWVNRQLVGVTGPVWAEPWPALTLATTTDGLPFQQNNAINMTWNPYNMASEYPLVETQSPYVTRLFYGTGKIQVTLAEYTQLNSNGLSAFTSTGP